MLVGEHDGFVDVPVTLNAPGTGIVTVNYTTADGTAKAPNSGTDYHGRAGTLTFEPGETLKTVRIEITNDAVAEPNETFTLNLNTPSANVTIARTTGTITIIDDDNSGVTVHEGGLGNDSYTTVASNDQIVESPFGGTDSVSSSVTYTLPKNVENLTLTGTPAINGTGNAANNILIGNGAINTLKGGAGNDTLTGNGGKDNFVFNSLIGFDNVTDFSSVDDTCVVSQAGISIGNGDTIVDQGVVRSSSGGFTTSSELVIFTADITGTIDATKAAAQIGSATSAYTTGATRVFVVDNGTQTAIYRFTSSGADAIVSASELKLVATMNTPSTALSDYKFVA
jgi:Ca2+-binding RTX toxin-like protein